MGRPRLSICVSCEASGSARAAGDGAALYERVKARRKERGLKEVFALEGGDCLGLCDTPCNLELSGERRSTYLRTNVDAVKDVELIIDAACEYAALEPGQEIPERRLPGQSGD